MLALWNDLDRTLASLDRVLSARPVRVQRAVRRSPRINFYDRGSGFRLTADVPGLSDADVEITLEGEELRIRGGRELAIPEGFKPIRSERASVKFDRTLVLPAPVNPDTAQATVKNGVLTIDIDKAAAAQPRTIKVQGA